MRDKNAVSFLFLLISFMAAIGFLSWDFRPDPVSADQDPTLFSSERAMAHVAVIASEPHPSGSPAHHAVREYIVNTIREMGLEPQMQEEVMVSGPANRQFISFPKNILVKIPGAQSSKNILFSAHYDTVPQSPGAGDNSSAVAAQLETMRALLAGPPPQNDLYFIFVDSEELDLGGARAFVERHPLAPSIDMVVNMDGRGSGGPVLLFETTNNNGQAVRHYKKAVSHPFGTSLAVEIYRLMPNATDFDHYKKLPNAQGLNLAHNDQPHSYHRKNDTVAALEERTLQHQGQLLLGLARYFGSNQVPDGRKDAVFAAIPLLGFVIYSTTWVWPLLILAVVMAVVALRLAAKARVIKVGSFFGGLVFSLALLALGGGTAWAGMALFKAIDPGGVLADMGILPYHLNEFHEVLLLIVTSVVILFCGIFHNLKNPEFICVASSLFWWGLLAALTAHYAPGASIFFFVPLLCSALGWVVFFKMEDEGWKRVALQIFALPTLMFILPLSRMLFIALGPMSAPLVGILLVLALFQFLSPFFALEKKLFWFPPLILLVTAAIQYQSFSSSTAKPTAEHPHFNSLFYAVDADANQAWWFTSEQEPDEWTSQYLTNEPGKVGLGAIFYGSQNQMLAAPTTANTLPLPVVEVVAERMEGTRRVVDLKIQSPRKAPQFRLYFTDGPVNLKIGDQVLREGNRFEFFGLPHEGLVLTCDPGKRDLLNIHVLEISYRLPSGVDRPDHFIPINGWIEDTIMQKKRIQIRPGENQASDQE